MHAEESEETPPSTIAKGGSVFSHDSTFMLIKKLMIYKMMGSNLFINYSLLGIRFAYRLFGKNLTNFAIENTAASVFTGGVTVSDLKQVSAELATRGIGSVGCYVVEGVRGAENTSLDQFLDFSVASIRSITEKGRKEGHFALKLTAYISTDLMERLNLAQQRFLDEVLTLSYDINDSTVLQREILSERLANLGIDNYSASDFDALVAQLSKNDTNNQMSNISLYKNGHLFQIYGERTALVEQIAAKLGGVTEADFADFDLFAGRARILGEEADANRCLLYVDAEQSFIQAAIESFG